MVIFNQVGICIQLRADTAGYVKCCFVMCDVRTEAKKDRNGGEDAWFICYEVMRVKGFFFVVCLFQS
jgi:hypothetical protein